MKIYIAHSGDDLTRLLNQYFAEHRIDPAQAHFYRASVLPAGKYRVVVGSAREARLFLRRENNVAPRLFDPFLGDLREGYEFRRQTFGIPIAVGWYVRQAASSLPGFLWAWLKRISGLEAVYRRTGR